MSDSTESSQLSLPLVWSVTWHESVWRLTPIELEPFFDCLSSVIGGSLDAAFTAKALYCCEWLSVGERQAWELPILTTKYSAWLHVTILKHDLEAFTVTLGAGSKLAVLAEMTVRFDSTLRALSPAEAA